MNIRKTFFKILLFFSGISVVLAEPTTPIKFDFHESSPGSGFIKNKGTLKFRAAVHSDEKGGSSGCLVKVDDKDGFLIGTSNNNCIISPSKPGINQVFAHGFAVKFGYTIPKKIADLRPANHVLTLASKYDNGINARIFSICTRTNGNLSFEVSKNGISIIGCGTGSILKPGKRAVIEARFTPRKEITLHVDGKRVARKTLEYDQLHQANIPICIGARLHHNKPINFGEGIIDSFTAYPLADKVEVKAADYKDPVKDKKNTEAKLPKAYRNAYNQENGIRGEICLNGMWLWQPQAPETKEQPDEKNWLLRKVPAFRHSSFKKTDLKGKKVHTYKGEKLTGKEKSWLGTEIRIPESWENRDIFFELQGVTGEEPMVIIDGKRMVISPDIPYKFPLEYTNKPIKVRIKADALKQNVWLRSYPSKNSIRFAGVSPSWRKKNLGVYIEGTCQPKKKLYARLIVLEKPGQKPVKKSIWHKIKTDNNTFTSKFAMPWSNPKEWTPDTPNLYYFSVELKNDANKLIDQTHPLRFGFREIWIEKGQLKLNGKVVNLRGNNHTPFGSKGSYSAYVGNRENIEWVLKNWKEKTNLNSFLIWAQSKCGMPDKDMVLEVADELGLLIVYQLPPGQRDFSDNDAVDQYNRRLLKGEVKRYAHHPSVFAWNLGSSHYTWICAPALLGQKFEPEKYWDKIRKQTDYFLPKKEMIKKIDPSRVFTTHSGGHNKVSDMLTGMVYINPDAGLQERANWPLGWWKNRENLKPLFLTEISCIFWGTFYQRKATNSFPSAKSEPIFLEHGAELFGDKVYQEEPAEFIEKYFDGKSAVGLFWWDKPSPTVWDFKREYLKYAYRAWRTFGIGFFLHVEIRNGFTKRHLPKQTKKPNIQAPGIYPDYPQNGNDAPGNKLSEWGKSIQKHLEPFYAYIGGDENFTSRDHAYYSGEQITKRAIILNDHFYPLPVEVEWKLIDSLGKTVFLKKYQKEIAPGERAIDDFRLQFQAPDVQKRTEYTLQLTASANGKIQEDQFNIQVFPRSGKQQNSNMTLHLFDPKGETRAMLDCAGYKIVSTDKELPDNGILVIGRHALEDENNVKKLATMGFDKKLISGLKVVVFEQACENILGLKAYENSPRRTFICAEGHPVLKGINPQDLWHWRGASDLVDPYPVPQKIPNAAGGWFPERFWKWSNDNNVATYVIQKPMKGAFRALINCGFDLMDTPLLESCKGNGRLIFCQLDVTKKYGIDPVASELVNNIFSYLKKAAKPNAELTEIKYEKGNTIFEGYRLKKPLGKLGWGLNNGDFYFRRKVKLPAFKNGKELELVKMADDKAIISYSIKDLQTNWQKYKYFKILTALRMNQGGSSNIGVSTDLHGDNDELYPVNWHFGFIHPYTGWCW